MKAVDIVVPVFNSHDMTWRCVTHLLLYAHPSWNIVVVDDASTEPAEEMFDYFRSKGVKVLRHEKNGGCHRAWNTGWRYGSAPQVCFINNDIVPSPAALSSLTAVVDNGFPYAGAVDSGGGGAFDPPALLKEPAVPSPAVSLKDVLQHGRDFNSFFVVRRDVLEALDGFDDRMKLVFADADFVERMAQRFYPPVVVPWARCFHGRSVSRKRVGVFRDVEQVMKDQIVFREKWKDRPDVLVKHPPYTRDSALASTQRVWNSEGER